MAKSQYTHDIVATIGEYTDRQTGEKKKRYVTIGKGFTDEQGRISCKLDCIPVGPEWSGWISLYPPKERDGPVMRPKVTESQRTAPPRAEAPRGYDNEAEDDIPF